MTTLHIFRTLAPTLFFIFISAGLSAQCVHPDYMGLEKFYVATNGADWNDNSGWLTDCEPCGWKGVTCDDDQRVISIVQRGNGLTGTLPEDFSGLPLLRLINLGYNEVGGELPASLFELDALVDIFLSGNRLTGNFPATFGSRPQLTLLRIGDNQLSGNLPGELADFPGMTILSLSGNNFKGSIPEGLGDYPNIFAIDLSNNDLEGCFPVDLENLCGNTRIRFGGNTKLSWKGNFTQFCASQLVDIDQVGAPCDDSDPDTEGDMITDNCSCGGSLDTDGILVDEPEVSGFTELEEPTSERFIRTNNDTPGVLPTVSPSVSRMTAFPNPLVGGTLNVRLPENLEGAEVRLMSLNGREITRTNNVSSGASLNVPVLQAGIYLLEAVSGTERSITRIIVQ